MLMVISFSGYWGRQIVARSTCWQKWQGVVCRISKCILESWGRRGASFECIESGRWHKKRLQSVVCNGSGNGSSLLVSPH